MIEFYSNSLLSSSSSSASARAHSLARSVPTPNGAICISKLQLEWVRARTERAGGPSAPPRSAPLHSLRPQLVPLDCLSDPTFPANELRFQTRRVRSGAATLDPPPPPPPPPPDMQFFPGLASDQRRGGTRSETPQREVGRSCRTDERT